MINTEILSLAIDLVTGRLCYHRIEDSGDILATKVDRVVSLETEVPCWMVKQTQDGECMSEKWIKNGIEIKDEKELTNNKIILPMSQWEEEV